MSKPRPVPFVVEAPFPESGDAFPLFRSLSARLQSSFFFDSFNARPLGRYSYFPLTAPRRRWTAAGPRDFERQWKEIRSEILPSKTGSRDTSRSNRFNPISSKSLPPFLGGAVVFLSYDCGRVFERGWKSRAPSDPLQFPWMEAGIYDDLYCLDHRSRKAFLISRSEPDARAALLQKLESALRGAPVGEFAGDTADASPGDGRDSQRAFASTENIGDQARFVRSVGKLKGYIAAGDIYQANLSRRIAVPYKGTGLDYFARLRKINPSPYAFYGRFGFGELASCSPELLLKKRGRILETRPIAGTRPRGLDKASDQRLQGELLLNAKERAEHVMLLDLERNDLGRVSDSGSVRVREKMVVEKYSHVMHIVSAVRSRIKYNQDVFKAIEAVFPGGTITGCPKVRCMNILDELEPVRRGPFYGSFGWIGYDGDCEMNLLIRTALLPKNSRTLMLQAGSGIVADSDPAREFEESGHKARALLAAAQSKKTRISP